MRLDQDGFTVMEQCLDGEIMPVAVIYSLDFLGLRPAYSIRLNIDWDRVQKHMDESFSASFLFSSTEIGKAVDELVDSRAIVLESDTFVPEGDDTQGIIDRRDAALAQVRNMITDAFFTPSLPPWTPEKKPDWERAHRDRRQGRDHRLRDGRCGSRRHTGDGQLQLQEDGLHARRPEDAQRQLLRAGDHQEVDTSARPSCRPVQAAARHAAATERFVRRVDLSNDWFKKRRLSVSTRSDFAADGIASINVRARTAHSRRTACCERPDRRRFRMVEPARQRRDAAGRAGGVRDQLQERRQHRTAAQAARRRRRPTTSRTSRSSRASSTPSRRSRSLAENFPWPTTARWRCICAMWTRPTASTSATMFRLTRTSKTACGRCSCSTRKRSRLRASA